MDKYKKHVNSDRIRKLEEMGFENVDEDCLADFKILNGDCGIMRIDFSAIEMRHFARHALNELYLQGVSDGTKKTQDAIKEAIGL